MHVVRALHICMMKRIRVGVNAMRRIKCLGSVMTMISKKGNALWQSVLTKQCLVKETETNTEPPGRGTEKSFLTDSNKLY
jgi:hypothetical protein